MTAKDQNGKVIHTERRKYDNWNLWFEGGKWVELRQWDITAATNIDLGLKPEQTDAETHIILLDNTTKSLDIDATFLFEYEPGHWETIKKTTKNVIFTTPRKYIKQ